MTRSWSIERRLFAWIAGSALAMSVLYGGAMVWIVDSTLDNELEVLGIEEIEEFEAEARGRTFAPSELEALMRAIADDHPEYRFSWRLWHPAHVESLSTFGWRARVPLPETWEGAVSAPRAFDAVSRWHTSEVPIYFAGEAGPSKLQVGLLLDATPRRHTARVAMASVLGVIGLMAVVASIGGRLLTRKVARTLREAAEHARNLDNLGTTDDRAAQGAPQEVQAVAAAFEQSLAALRGQHARNLLLTAGMAHELRSPLQNVLSEVSVALLRDREPGEYRAVLESLLDELRDFGRVVDNLITLTALREPGALDRTERLCLGTEAEMRFGKELARAERRGVELTIEREGNLAIQGDREALLLTLRNLLDNAVRCAESRVEMRLLGGEAEIVATVDDDGPGVPTHLRESIFEAFEQAPARAGRRGGFGLGLALARAAVEAHGGTLEVSDAPLGGARFEVRLPQGRFEASSGPSGAAANGRAIRS